MLVFVDRAERDRGYRATSGGRLRYFRREFGVFVLYEVSPFDKPHPLDRFREAAPP